MKKRKLQIVALFILLVAVIPISASAWGGYVSAIGQKTYHIIYCEKLLEHPYNQLRWYDTQKQAESAGLSPCEECEAGDWFDFEKLDGSFFETNDKLLDAAFDAALDYGSVGGYENGYEVGYYDGIAAAEYGSAYNSDKKYTSDELDEIYYESYSDGYDDGYDIGYDKGYEQGKTHVNDDLEDELKKEFEEEKNAVMWGTLFSTLFLVNPILFMVLSAIPQDFDLRKILKQIYTFIHTPYGFAAGILIATVCFIVYLYFA